MVRRAFRWPKQKRHWIAAIASATSAIATSAYRAIDAWGNAEFVTDEQPWKLLDSAWAPWVTLVAVVIGFGWIILAGWRLAEEKPASGDVAAPPAADSVIPQQAQVGVRGMALVSRGSPPRAVVPEGSPATGATHANDGAEIEKFRREWADKATRHLALQTAQDYVGNHPELVRDLGRKSLEECVALVEAYRLTGQDDKRAEVDMWLLAVHPKQKVTGVGSVTLGSPRADS